MQTFLPYPDFQETARCLDWRRLGCQRKEALQAIQVTLQVNSGIAVKGWVNHPTRLMWAENIHALCEYGIAICDEWISRGYKDAQRAKFEAIREVVEYTGMPEWLGDERLHSSHRASLLFKNMEWYGQFGWSEFPKIDYIWPSKMVARGGIPVGILVGS